MEKQINDPDDIFTLGNSMYLGKISASGLYVAPNDLDCATDSFPGVWDIEKKEKAVFEASNGKLIVEDKCQALFSGDQDLSALDGT